jgi:tRNA(adenine34) deaminase
MLAEYDDVYFMKQAIKQAKIAFDKDEVPVGAVVVNNQQIIAKSYNQIETLNDVTAHAEMLAFTAAADFLGGKYLNNCTLYVTLEPCQMCAGASYWTQIDKIVFGAFDSKRGYQILGTRLHPKTKVIGGILEEECSELLTSFFERKRC